MQIDFNQWIGIIASITSLISFVINVFQWRSSENLKKQYYSHIFSEWNQMFRIAELADESRAIHDDSNQPETQRLNLIIRKIEQITGISDGSRQGLLSFAEKYFKKPIYRQHPAIPDPKFNKS